MKTSIINLTDILYKLSLTLFYIDSRRYSNWSNSI